MYAQHLMWYSAVDICFRQNGSGLSLPVTPSIHGASTTRTISCLSTPKYLDIRKSMASLQTLLIILLPTPPRRAKSGRHSRLIQIHLPMIRVAQQYLLMRAEPRSDYERWIPRTVLSILASRRRRVEKRCPFKEANRATLHRIQVQGPRLNNLGMGWMVVQNPLAQRRTK